MVMLAGVVTCALPVTPATALDVSAWDGYHSRTDVDVVDRTGEDNVVRPQPVKGPALAVSDLQAPVHAVEPNRHQAGPQAAVCSLLPGAQVQPDLLYPVPALGGLLVDLGA